jgi:hypothetical protein
MSGFYVSIGDQRDQVASECRLIVMVVVLRKRAMHSGRESKRVPIIFVQIDVVVEPVGKVEHVELAALDGIETTVNRTLADHGPVY